MHLKAAPPPVTRLSRRALMVIGLTGGLGLGMALIYALQPRDYGEGGAELYTTGNRQAADGLQTLPRDYTGPRLGPPLPGDLGRPILDAQTRGEPVIPPAMDLAPMPDEAEQRRLAEEEAARSSGLFVQSAPGGAAPGLILPDFGQGAGGVVPSSGAEGFLGRGADRQPVAPDRVMPPASPYLLQAGSVIPAALITGIRSDLPGQITAQVTESVYDSPSGRFLLIPQGTRLIGEYSADVGFGQRRVLLVWTRLILPDGRSLGLERLPGADPQGFAGLEDGVDYHGWELMKAAGLATVLAAGVELAAEDADPLARALREGLQGTIGDVGQEIVSRQLDVAPRATRVIGRSFQNSMVSGAR
ncbi:MAG: TrbI/VirB10 family protein, partial [Paracoccus sp. (in: a-proteobacteria)]|uniref:TrbI/VirB10 family protein n=1 Tax=Paracoccus sp. TaxID=267 RepID=UPI0026DF1FFE